MSFVQEFEIEKYGIVHTVLATNPDHFIIGYTNQLMATTFEKEPELVKVLIVKLLTWYDEGNYEQVMKSKWCYNKDNQTKTYKLLKHYVDVFGIKYISPEKKELNHYKYKQDPETEKLHDMIFKNY